MTEGVLLHSESLAQPDQLVASRFLSGDPFVYIEVAGRRVLAVGDFEVGRATQESGADEVWSYSDLGLTELYAEGLDRHAINCELALRAARRAGLDATFAEDAEQALGQLLPRLRSRDVVLVKASRGVRAERLVQGLVAAIGRAA